MGGPLLALRLCTRPAAFFVLATVPIAAFVRQAGNSFVERELALLYGFVAVQCLLTRRGRLGLDGCLHRREAKLAAGPALLLFLALTGCGSEAARPSGDSAASPIGHLATRYPEEIRAGAHVLSGSLIARGDSLYHGALGQANCVLCHGPFLRGGSHGTNLRDGTWHHGDGSYQFLVSVTRNGVEKAAHSPIPRMPPMGGNPLTDDQIRALAAYVYWFSNTRRASDEASRTGAHENSDGARGVHGAHGTHGAHGPTE